MPTLLKVAEMDKKEISDCLQRETSGECSQANSRGPFLRPHAFHSQPYRSKEPGRPQPPEQVWLLLCCWK